MTMPNDPSQPSRRSTTLTDAELRSTPPGRPALTRDKARGLNWTRFARHFLEMVVAMVVGMAMLGMATRLLLGQVGQASLLDHTEVAVAIMTVNMSVGMAVLMRFRGHDWVHIAEMSAAMAATFLVLLVPFWLGVMSGAAVTTLGHVLMLPSMLLVMLRRRDVYGRDHRRLHQASTQP
jgi:ABC-type branched-subunit amino acid transport system permease subunit